MVEGNSGRRCLICSAKMQRKTFSVAEMPINVFLISMQMDVPSSDVQREECPNCHCVGWFIPAKVGQDRDFPLSKAVKE